MQTQKRPILSLFACAALLLLCRGVSAGAYNVNAPVYPVTYTDAQKESQRAAGRAIAQANQ